MIAIEEGEKSFDACVPDLPGRVAVGESGAEVKQLIQEGIEFHLEDLRETGAEIPKPFSKDEFFAVVAA